MMSSESTLWYLKNFSFFECLSESEFEEFARLAQLQVLPRKGFVFYSDDDGEYVYFLKRGHVKLSRLLPDGKEAILDVVSPGEFFGQIESRQRGTETSEDVVEALDEALICVFRRTDFEKILDENPKLNREVLKQVGDRFLRFQERMIDIAFRDARSRVASFVLRYATEIGYLTHQEIAYLTSLSRQTVTVHLNEFRDAGLISFDRQGISVLDEDGLKHVSS